MHATLRESKKSKSEKYPPYFELKILLGGRGGGIKNSHGILGSEKYSLYLEEVKNSPGPLGRKNISGTLRESKIFPVH